MEGLLLELRRSSSAKTSADASDPTVGAIVASVGNFLISLSFQLQKLAHRRNESSDSTIHYTRLPLWWAGMALMGVGEVGNFFAYGLAPASLISPLGAVAVISNCILARTILKEKLTYRNMLGVSLSLAGAMLVILFAPRTISDKASTQEDSFLYDMLVNWRSGIYLLVVLLLAAYVANPCLSGFAVSENRREKNVVFYVSLCGLFGIITVMSAKGVSLSLKSLLTGDFVPFTGAHCWLVYLLIFSAIISIILQMKYLNKAMMGFGAQQVVPVYYVTFTLSTISAGMVLYLEVDFVQWWRSFLFGCGIIVTFIGVWLINQKYEEEEYGFPENGEGTQMSEESMIKPQFNEKRKFSGRSQSADDLVVGQDWPESDPKPAMCVLLEKEVASCSDLETNRDEDGHSDPLAQDLAPNKAEIQGDNASVYLKMEDFSQIVRINFKSSGDCSASNYFEWKKKRIYELYPPQVSENVQYSDKSSLHDAAVRNLDVEQKVDDENSSFQLTVEHDSGEEQW